MPEKYRLLRRKNDANGARDIGSDRVRTGWRAIANFGVDHAFVAGFFMRRMLLLFGTLVCGQMQETMLGGSVLQAEQAQHGEQCN